MTCSCDGARCLLAPDDERHGSYHGYNNLYCRCRPCRDANATYHREQRRLAARRTCPGCGGKGGNHRGGECRACWRYRHRTGIDRTEGLAAKAHRRQAPAKPAVPDEKPPRTVELQVRGGTATAWVYTCRRCGWETPPTLNQQAAEATCARHEQTSHPRRRRTAA